MPYSSKQTKKDIYNFGVQSKNVFNENATKHNICALKLLNVFFLFFFIYIPTRTKINTFFISLFLFRDCLLWKKVLIFKKQLLWKLNLLFDSSLTCVWNRSKVKITLFLRFIWQQLLKSCKIMLQCFEWYAYLMHK